MRGVVLSVAAVAATVALAVGFVVHRSGAAAATHLGGDVTWAAGARTAPAIPLRDQAGRAFRLADLRGRVVLLTFMDSHCTTECPVEGHQLAVVQRAFPAARRPVILVVSVNPNDTPRSVRRFASMREWQPGWRWLMGTRAQLRRVWRAYGITVVPSTHDIIHSAALYLIDASGHERSGYVAPFLPNLVTADVRALEAEHA